nr:MAG TPA: hypothetical protein [Caudoviricetes sp.]
MQLQLTEQNLKEFVFRLKDFNFVKEVKEIISSESGELEYVDVVFTQDILILNMNKYRFIYSSNLTVYEEDTIELFYSEYYKTHICEYYEF